MDEQVFPFSDISNSELFQIFKPISVSELSFSKNFSNLPGLNIPNLFEDIVYSDSNTDQDLDCANNINFKYFDESEFNNYRDNFKKSLFFSY